MIYSLLFGASTHAYTVHEGPTPPHDRVDRAEALRFIKDGFSLPAFITAPFWLAGHKLWIALAGYAAAVALIFICEALFDWHEIISLLTLLGVHLVVGFEADSIERLTLEQQGWQTIGSVTGSNALDCERRFFDDWLPRQPVLGTVAAMAAPKQAGAQASSVRTIAPADQSVAGRLAALWSRKKQ